MIAAIIDVIVIMIIFLLWPFFCHFPNHSSYLIRLKLTAVIIAGWPLSLVIFRARIFQFIFQMTNKKLA